MVSVTRDEFLQHEDATKDVIDVKRIYIDMAGDLVAGVLLSQIVFWHLPSKQNGNSKLRVYHKGEYWIAKKREDWWDECRVTPKQADRAIKELEDSNLIISDVLKFDGSPTKHIRIDWPVFLASYENLLHSYTAEGGKSKLPKGKNRNTPKGNIEINQTVKSLTETTPETPAETKDSGAKPAPPPDKEKEPTPANARSQVTTKLPDSEPVIRAKREIAAALDEMMTGHEGVADPRKAEQAFVKEFSPLMGRIFGRDEPIREDRAATRDMFQFHCNHDWLIEQLTSLIGEAGNVYRQPSKNGKKPNDYWVRDAIEKEWSIYRKEKADAEQREREQADYERRVAAALASVSPSEQDGGRSCPDSVHLHDPVGGSGGNVVCDEAGQAGVAVAAGGNVRVRGDGMGVLQLSQPSVGAEDRPGEASNGGRSLREMYRNRNVRGQMATVDAGVSGQKRASA